MLRMLLTGPIGIFVYFLTGVLVSCKLLGALEISWWLAWFPLWFTVLLALLWATAYTISVMIHTTRR